jgi:hypothetical protein
VKKAALGGGGIHGHLSAETIGGCSIANSPKELNVDFDPQSTQTHEVVISRVRGKESGLQHHFFGIEADALIGGRIVVVAANGIRICP